VWGLNFNPNPNPNPKIRKKGAAFGELPNGVFSSLSTPLFLKAGKLAKLGAF